MNPLVSSPLPTAFVAPLPVDPSPLALVVPITSLMASQVPPKRKGGRNADPVWREVIVFAEDKTVVCKKCEGIIHELGYTHVERVRQHMAKKCPKRLRTAKITSLYPAALADNLREFHQALANWTFQAGLSFNCLESDALLSALRLLHPQATVPTSRAISGVHLNNSYAASVALMEGALRGKLCTLTTDAWTDVNGFSVINYIAVHGDATYFLESAYTGSVSHDAAFLAADVKRVMAKYPGLAFCCVVTDNTAANQAMWRLLEPEFPGIFFHGCASHVVHLLVKELCSKIGWLSELASGYKLLVKHFKKCHSLLHELTKQLRKNGRRNLALPVDTRWGTLERCFASILGAEPFLHAMVSRREFIAGDKNQKTKRRFIHDLVREEAFVPNLERAQKLLEHLSKFLRRFERNKTSPSEVYEMFTTLPIILGDVGLSAAEMVIVKRKVSPLVFWSGLTDFPLLRTVAVSAFSSACSSAAVERSFSAQRFIHSTLRNRLADERVEKLLHVYFNGKNKADNHSEFFDEIDQLLEPSEEENGEDSDFEYY